VASLSNQKWLKHIKINSAPSAQCGRVHLFACFPWIDPSFRWIELGFQWINPTFQWIDLRFQWIDPNFQWIDLGFQ
jgi:hypothetical protein